MSTQTHRRLHTMQGNYVGVVSNAIPSEPAPNVRGGSSHLSPDKEAQVIFRQSPFHTSIASIFNAITVCSLRVIVMDLDHIPVAAPPPPQVSNFVDPPTLTITLVVISALCLVLMIPFAAIRLYCKAFIVRSFGWDDGALKFKLRLPY